MITKLHIQHLSEFKEFPFHIATGKLSRDYAVHSHDFSELFVILSGSARHMIGHTEHPVVPGDVYVINGDVPHAFTHVQALEICNINFHTHTLFDDSSALKRLSGYQALFLLEPYYREEFQYQSKLHLDPVKLEVAKGFIQLLLKEYREKAQGCEQAIIAYVKALAVFLAREYDSVSQGRNEVMSLAKVMAYIETNFQQPLKLDDLGAQENISSRHFCRIFRKFYSCSPIHYIIRLRIGHACSLLASTDLTIHEVAISSGFSNSNYFSREFKKILNLSPSEYRKKYFSSLHPGKQLPLHRHDERGY